MKFFNFSQLFLIICPALITLNACSDHLAEGEDILAESQVDKDYFTYLTHLQQRQSYELRMLFSTHEVGSTIDSIEFKFTSPYLMTDYYYHYELGTLPSYSLQDQTDTLSLRAYMSLDTNSSSFPHRVGLYMTATPPQVAQDTLLQISLDKQILRQAHHVFGVATDSLADDGNSVLNSLLQSLKKAQTQAQLAYQSNHNQHFRHVAQFLYGREGRNPEWVKNAPINSVDTISVTEQLNYIERYLIDQAQWTSDEHSDKLIQLTNGLTHLHDELAFQMELMADWFDIEDNEAKSKAEKLIAILNEGIPLLQNLISEVSPHLIQKVELK